MKILQKNSIFLFSENLLQKIEPSEITPFFLNNFFGSGGGGDFPPFPLAIGGGGVSKLILRPCQIGHRFSQGLSETQLLFRELSSQNQMGISSFYMLSDATFNFFIIYETLGFRQNIYHPKISFEFESLLTSFVKKIAPIFRVLGFPLMHYPHYYQNLRTILLKNQ